MLPELMKLCVIMGFRYASEFGTGGSSSFESMAGTLSPQHWGLHGGMAADNCTGNGNGDPDQPMGSVKCLGEHVCHPHGEGTGGRGTGAAGNPMTQRNYGCDGQIRLYFGKNTLVDLNATGEAAFKGQLYQCQLVQAFVLKQVYEQRRAANAFGHLVWMLNEIWPVHLNFLHCAPSFQSGLQAKSEFEACFRPSALGAGAKNMSRTQEYRNFRNFATLCFRPTVGWGSLEYGQ